MADSFDMWYNESRTESDSLTRTRKGHLFSAYWLFGLMALGYSASPNCKQTPKFNDMFTIYDNCFKNSIAAYWLFLEDFLLLLRSFFSLLGTAILTMAFFSGAFRWSTACFRVSIWVEHVVYTVTWWCYLIYMGK